MRKNEKSSQLLQQMSETGFSTTIVMIDGSMQAIVALYRPMYDHLICLIGMVILIGFGTRRRRS